MHADETSTMRTDQLSLSDLRLLDLVLEDYARLGIEPDLRDPAWRYGSAQRVRA